MGNKCILEFPNFKAALRTGLNKEKEHINVLDNTLTKECSDKVNFMELVNCSSITVKVMRESGILALSKVTELIAGQIKVPISDSLKRVSKKEKESISVKMDKYLKADGSKANAMEKVG